MKVTFLHILWLGLVSFFAGMFSSLQAGLIYLYHVHNSGVTFTGSIFGDWVSLAAAIVGTWVFSKELYLIRKSVLQQAKDKTGRDF